MAATADPSRDRLSPEEIQDERLIAAACRKARLRNEEISKKREQLRNEIRDIQQRSYTIEARYWGEYQNRLRDIHDANSKWSTRKWISAFAENEKTLLQAVAKRQDKLREEERLKQEELAAVDREFWAAWGRDVELMGGLSPLPPSSGSTPAAMEPMAVPQPADNRASKALPATHSSNGRPSVSKIYSSKVQKQRVTRSSVRTGPSPFKKSTTATKPVNAQRHSLSPASRALKAAAVARAQGTSLSAATTPSPHMLSPDPSVSATSSMQRRRPRSSSAAASPREQSEDSLSAPASRSLSPKSAITSVESQGESSQEPADNLNEQPAIPQDAAAAETQSLDTPAAGDPAEPSPSSDLELTTPQGQDGGFLGVTEPVVGEIYQGFYKDAKYQGWWMCTPLPWDSWEREIGIKYSTQQANLFKDLPDCYTTDRVRAKAKGRKMKSVITGWKKGFESGGPRARERVFPVLFFDDVPGEPGSFKFPDSPAKTFAFNKRALSALPAEWVAAADLRMPGADVGRPVRGRETAERFRERVRAWRALRAEKKVGTPKKNRTGSFVEASSPVEGSSAVGLSSPAEVPPAVDHSSAVDLSSPMEAPASVDRSSAVEETNRDDIEMADAESLSGATAVDDAPAGQPDVVEGSKAPSTPAAKTPPVEKTSPNSSEKEWRSVVFG